MMAAVFNALLLMLWLRIVPVAPDESVGNPMVSYPLTRADRLAELIRPAFGPHATRGFVALLLLVFALVLRGFAVQAAGGGLTLQAGPAVFVPNLQSGAACVLFSALSFAWMVQRMWLVTAVLRLFRRRRPFTQGDGLAESLSAPVSRLSAAWRIELAALFALVLSAATIHVGVSRSMADAVAALQGQSMDLGGSARILQVASSVFPDFRSPTATALLLMTVGSLADVITVASDLVVAAVVVQIVALLLRWPYGVALGAAGLEYVVGAFFPRPMRLAGMNMSPLVFLILAGIVYAVVFNLAIAATLVLTGSITPETLRAMQEAIAS